jgi:DNA replication protein DnaD
MDAVLANWNRDGLRTLADIENSEASFQARKAEKAGKKPAPDGQGSFNTDDFFAAAVRRSFGDDFDPDKKDA